MARRPLIVLADDLTGAAEVAALAHEAGLHSVVVTRIPRSPVEIDVLVVDTDTRLLSPGMAARRVRARAARLSSLPHAGIFKKTDSVLRGPVLAELAAIARACGLRRSLLVAGNPSLSRIIHDGRCYIDGQPIDRTAFARDPHHPALSADVLDLLHAAGRPDVVYRAPGDKLPRNGIIVGQNRHAADAATWVAAVDKHTLPAGSADFFRAWLARFVSTPKAPANALLPSGPLLLLHGTTAAPAAAGALFFQGLRPPSVARVAQALRQHKATFVSASPLTLKDPLAPPQIAQNFAALALALRDASPPAFHHLLIAGGTTAATVLRALGWNRLSVVRVWAPGVVSLQPNGTAFIVTLKPGSYPWPAGLRHLAPQLFS